MEMPIGKTEKIIEHNGVEIAKIVRYGIKYLIIWTASKNHLVINGYVDAIMRAKKGELYQFN